MTRRFSKGIAFAAVLLLATGSARAQWTDLQILMPRSADMPRTIDEWRSDPTLVQFIATNTTSSSIQAARLSFRVTGSIRGQVVMSKDLHPEQPVFQLGAFETRTFFWDDLIGDLALEFSTDLTEKVAVDGIPEDYYQLCAQVIDGSGQSLSVSGERCAPFRVFEPDPPSLLYPILQAAVDPSTVLFQWTPVNSPRTIEYLLIVRPVFPGQSTITAFESNPVLLETVAASNQYQVLPSDPPFDTFDGAAGFVWQVQARVDGEPYGRDEGISPVGHFTLAEPLVSFEDEWADGWNDPADDGEPTADRTRLGMRSLFAPTPSVGSLPGLRGGSAGDHSFQTPAQAKIVGLSGGLTASFDTYSQNGLTRDRRPGSMGLVNGQISLKVADQINVPFSTYASTESAGLEHPFNQFGVSPQIYFARLHAGYFSTEFSDLTLGDARILGAGIELTPGPLRLAAVRGQNQRSNFAGGLQIGQFRQNLTSIQAGFGKRDSWHFWMTGLHARDDLGSVPIPTGTSYIKPQENVVASIRFGLPIIPKRLVLDAEGAASAYSQDTRAERLESDVIDKLPGWVTGLFTPVVSSRADVAAKASLQLRPVDQFAVAVRGQVVGPGYKSLGASQLEADVFDLTVNPQLQLRRLSLDVSVGTRQNNIARTRLSSTSRTIVNANMSLRPTTWLNLATQYSNYGMRSSSDNDTLKVENVSQIMSIAPSVTFATGKIRQMVRTGYSYQEFADKNLLTGRLGDTKTHNVTLSHTLSWNTGLSLTTTGVYIRGLASSIDSKILSLSETIGFQLMQRKLRISSTLGWNRTRTIAADTGIQVRAQGSYKLNPKNELQLGLQLRRFNYGIDRNGSDGFTEVTTRFGYRVTF